MSARVVARLAWSTWGLTLAVQAGGLLFWSLAGLAPLPGGDSAGSGVIVRVGLPLEAHPPLALAALWSPALTSGNHSSTTHLSPESPSTRVSQLVGQERRMCLNAVICVSFVAQLDHPPYCVRCTTVTPPPEPNVQELTAGPPAEGQFANS